MREMPLARPRPLQLAQECVPTSLLPGQAWLAQGSCASGWGQQTSSENLWCSNTSSPSSSSLQRNGQPQTWYPARNCVQYRSSKLSEGAKVAFLLQHLIIGCKPKRFLCHLPSSAPWDHSGTWSHHTLGGSRDTSGSLKASRGSKVIPKPGGPQKAEDNSLGQEPASCSACVGYALKYRTFRLDQEYYDSAFVPSETESRKTFINSPC